MNGLLGFEGNVEVALFGFFFVIKDRAVPTT